MGADRRFTCLVLAVMAVCGICMVFRTPPMSGFDEPFHWRRAQQVASGIWFAQRHSTNDWGGVLDNRTQTLEDFLDDRVARGKPVPTKEVKALARRLGQQPLVSVEVDFPSTASFAPLAYLPSGAGIFLARRVHANPLNQFYAGRLAQLLGWLVLVSANMWVWPFGRRLVLLLLTVPTQLHLATCFSADPVTVTLSAFYLGLCLRLRFDSWKELGTSPRYFLSLVFCIAALIGLLKITSVAFAPIAFLVPRRLFVSRTRAWLFRIGATAVCVNVGLAWMLAYPFVPGFYWGTHPDPVATTRLIEHAPVSALIRVFHELKVYAVFWWLDGYGRFGGAPDPYSFTFEMEGKIFLFFWALMALATPRPQEAYGRTAVGVFFCGLGVAYAFLLVFAFWVAYTPLNVRSVIGLQGRYFMPPFMAVFYGLWLALPWQRGLPRSAMFFALACLCLDGAVIIGALRRYAPLW